MRHRRGHSLARLRWHLHELDPALQVPARSLHRRKHLQAIKAFLAGCKEPSTRLVTRLAGELVERCQDLTEKINAVERKLKAPVPELAPALLSVVGCAHLTAAKIVGETAGVDPFRSRRAFARYHGTAPLPVWSGNRDATGSAELATGN